MRAFRRALGPRLVLAIWAHLAFLPPGAWALCFSDQGHVAIEPLASTCSEEEDAASPDAECAAASCDDCVDIPVLRGQALQKGAWRIAPPVSMSCVGLTVMEADARSARLSSSRRSYTLFISPSELGTILRC